MRYDLGYDPRDDEIEADFDRTEPYSACADRCMECGIVIEPDQGWCDDCYQTLERYGFFEETL